MTNIMNHVDFLDLVKITVTRFPNSGQFKVFVEAIEKNKKVIFDEDALRTMNNKITEVCKEKKLSALDPNTVGYIKEFIEKLVSELARHGLIELVEYEDQPDDPYAKIRQQYEKYGIN